MSGKHEKVFVLKTSELEEFVAYKQRQALKAIYTMAKQNPRASWKELIGMSTSYLTDEQDRVRRGEKPQDLEQNEVTQEEAEATVEEASSLDDLKNDDSFGMSEDELSEFAHQDEPDQEVISEPIVEEETLEEETVVEEKVKFDLSQLPEEPKHKFSFQQEEEEEAKVTRFRTDNSLKTAQLFDE